MPRSPSARRGARPAWLVEGIALYVSGDRRVGAAARYAAARRRRPSARRALTLTGLSAPGAIGRLGGDGQSAAYAYSSAAAFYDRRALRPQALPAALRRLQRREVDCSRQGAELTAAAVRKTLGIALLELERDLRRSDRHPTLAATRSRGLLA